MIVTLLSKWIRLVIVNFFMWIYIGADYLCIGFYTSRPLLFFIYLSWHASLLSFNTGAIFIFYYINNLASNKERIVTLKIYTSSYVVNKTHICNMSIPKIHYEFCTFHNRDRHEHHGCPIIKKPVEFIRIVENLSAWNKNKININPTSTWHGHRGCDHKKILKLM